MPSMSCARLAIGTGQVNSQEVWAFAGMFEAITIVKDGVGRVAQPLL